MHPRYGLIVHRNGIRDAFGTRLSTDLARDLVEADVQRLGCVEGADRGRLAVAGQAAALPRRRPSGCPSARTHVRTPSRRPQASLRPARTRTSPPRPADHRDAEVRAARQGSPASTSSTICTETSRGRARPGCRRRAPAHVARRASPPPPAARENDATMSPTVDQSSASVWWRVACRSVARHHAADPPPAHQQCGHDSPNAVTIKRRAPPLSRCSHR